MVYDVIIIGAGPAGLTAAIYAARYKLNVIIIGRETGGMAATAHKICNYPSYNEISGTELMMKMVEQVKALGVKILNEEVLKITGSDRKFVVKTRKNEYKSKKIIYAGGTKRSKLGAIGEEEFVGKGISYCVTCDAAFFREKKVVVVGGGDSALTSALLLSEYSPKVTIVYRGDNFSKADPSWVELVDKNKKIEFLFGEEISEIYGNKMVEGVKLKSGKDLKLEGVFVEIGSIPHTYILDGLNVKRNKKGYIVTDKSCRTSASGIYAAGDITDNILKQIVVACGEGAVAAYSVFQELKNR